MLRVFQWAEELISLLQGTLDFDISAVNDPRSEYFPTCDFGKWRKQYNR